MQNNQSVQHIHGTRGVQIERAMHCAERDREPVRVPTIADAVPLTDIMSRDMICVRRDVEAERVAELMVLEHVGCLPVVDEPGRPIGMITKLDLVERVAARAEGIAMHTAGTLMMPMSIALKEQATIAHAAALMANEDIHHLCVVDVEGRLIGVVSTMDIVRWLARNDGV